MHNSDAKSRRITEYRPKSASAAACTRPSTLSSWIARVNMTWQSRTMASKTHRGVELLALVNPRGGFSPTLTLETSLIVDSVHPLWPVGSD